MKKCIFLWLGLVLHIGLEAISINQTPDISPIHSGEKLPFNVKVELADFALPDGLHSGVQATYNGRWILLAGRTNGMHGFNPTGNFPPSAQNTFIYVINPLTGEVASKDLMDSSSGLSPLQIDLLSVTSPQSYQRDDTIYMTGGYGIDTASGLFSTKPYLTAIDLPGLVEWVTNPFPTKPLVSSVRHLENSIFQVTGGYMARGEGNLTLLIFGQNFMGEYTPGSNGHYTDQVRRFHIHDNGKHLSIKLKRSDPLIPDPNYRRRDLNVVPMVRNLMGESVPSFIALSGVFTEAGGIWTVPVIINTNGKTEMDSPENPSTFKQGMNNYVCPTLGMYSGNFGSMYFVLFGGISFGFFDETGFHTDPQFPFINQITTVEYNPHAKFKQYLMSNQYPVIPSTFSNPGNPLLFGAGAYFFPVKHLSAFDNDVIKYDHLHKGETLIGFIVGGIASTLPNTNTQSDSGASPYIFRVIVEKTN